MPVDIDKMRRLYDKSSGENMYDQMDAIMQVVDALPEILDELARLRDKSRAIVCCHCGKYTNA